MATTIRSSIRMWLNISPRCRLSNVTSHRLEASIIPPRITFRVFIQRPGFGSNKAVLGISATNSHGKLMPTPSIRKISHRECSGAPSAKATAVPRNGAEHGVASSVANTPSQKLPVSPVPPVVASRPVAAEGRNSSNAPNRFSAKIKVTATISPINHGFWNWMPQPSDAPVSFRTVTIVASSIKEVRIPALVARKRSRIFRVSVPACRTLLSFMPITGNTQGIRFRISPPSRAKASILTVPAGALCTASAGAAPTVSCVCWALSPLVTTNDSVFPASVVGLSPHSSVTGTAI